MKATSEWFPAQARGLAGGVYNIGASVGSMLASPLVAWAILRHSWQWGIALPRFLADPTWGILSDEATVPGHPNFTGAFLHSVDGNPMRMVPGRTHRIVARGDQRCRAEDAPPQ